MLYDFKRENELPDRLETDLVRILYYDFPQKYKHAYNSYEYTRLCTVLEGEKKISVNHDHYTYDSGQFLLMPAESYVDMTIDTPTKALVFELNDSLIQKVSGRVSLEYKIDYDALVEDKFLISQLTPELKDIIRKMSGTLESNGGKTEYILDLYAQELVYYLLKVKGSNQILTYEINNPINRAIQYMEKECMKPISIKQVANDLDMSEANFCQYFKKVTGISPKEYLTHLKMEKAREIITHESVTDTAMDLGYENISHFISLFKDKYGVTPKQYKKASG